MARLTSPRRRTAHDVARGLGAIVVLAMLIGGTPIVLWNAGGSPLPESWPSSTEVWNTITRPDDGSFFLEVLIFVGWIGWVLFTISVLVEIPAALRGVVAPGMPGLGGQQRFVAGLIAAVVAMIPTTQMAMADTPSTPGRLGQLDRSEPAPPVTKELLDERARKIAARQDSDAMTTRAGPAPDSAIYRVVPGDTLWDIAEANLGDSRRYQEIFAASTATVQPDGRRLDDPNLIVPGWRLTIPSAAARQAPSPSKGGDPLPPSDVLPGTGAANGTGQVSAPGAGEVECHATSEDREAADADHPENAIVAGSRPADSGDAGSAVGEPPATDLGGLARTGAGIGAALASGLVAALVARRSYRQRRRRVGEPLPDESAAGREAEVQLRHVADPSGVQFIDRALRTLNARLARQGKPLPSLQVARFHGPVLELSLAAPAGLPLPFRHVSDGLVWKVDSRAAVLQAPRDSELPAPYPSLVTIGHDDEGRLVLLDLERCGVLSVSGTSVTVDAAMAALAAELATSVWADDLRVTLVGCSGRVDLDVLETGRVRRVDDIGRLLDELTLRAKDDRTLLGQAGSSGLADARSRQLAEDTWTPEILLIGTPPSAGQQERLAALINAEPRLAIAAVIKEPSRDRPVTAGWSLHIDSSSRPAAVLEPLGLTVRPQLLADDEYGRFVDQLRTWDMGDRRNPVARYPSIDAAAAASTATGTTGEREARERETGALPPKIRSGPVVPQHVVSQPIISQPVVTQSVGRSQSGTRGKSNPPRLIMLGPVEVVDTAELGEPNKLGQLTELAMFIALQPACDARAIDEAIWPGSVVTRTTRNTAISKLRRWLGTDDDGAPWLPRTEGRYTFHPKLRSDWQEWCSLVPGSPDQASTAELRSALSLVKGRPFSGRGRRKYAWVDRHVQEMIAAIVDVCHELAVRALSDGDPREALRVCLVGLSIEPGVEVLWRDRLKAEATMGDRALVLESIDKLRDGADELGGDLDEETESLIEQILRPGPRI